MFRQILKRNLIFLLFFAAEFHEDIPSIRIRPFDKCTESDMVSINIDSRTGKILINVDARNQGNEIVRISDSEMPRKTFPSFDSIRVKAKKNNEWMNEWMNDGVNEWMNESVFIKTQIKWAVVMINNYCYFINGNGEFLQCMMVLSRG